MNPGSTDSGGRRSVAARRFAFISPCGWGNLGDAAIIDSLIHGIRSRVPGSTITGYSLHWLDTEERHGVEAHPLSSFSLPFYPLLPAGVEGPYELPAYDGSDAPVASPSTTGASVRGLVKSRRWVVNTVGAAVGAVRARREPAALRELRSSLEGTEAVVVAGGGQLDALFGGVFGQPYVLWRWARSARAVGARFLVLSVGTGTLDGLERRVVIRALRLADHRSYRDDVSREMLRDPELTAGDPIVPDLAYALPIVPGPPPDTDRIVVGVSPMNYQHPDFYPAGDSARYERHITGMFDVCIELLALGHDIVLFTTDASDDIALADLVIRLRATPTGSEPRWSVAGARTVEELMDTYARVHAVVAARLHGVLLGHVAHRPVLALAHERKVRALMAASGHERLCFDLADVDQYQLHRGLRELIDDREQLGREIAATVENARRAVERQYDTVFASDPGRPAATR